MYSASRDVTEEPPARYNALRQEIYKLDLAPTMDSTNLQDAKGTPFSVLMDQAVRLKNAQLASSRSRYDSYPTFYQNTIFPQPEVVGLRSLDIAGRLEGGQRLKEDGNAAYYKGDYEEAMRYYEMALSVFCYLENTNPRWKSEGIKDEDITEVSHNCQSDDEREQISSFLLSCYGNMALATLKSRQYQTTIDACNLSLQIDGRCVKALYLRARARIEPLSAGVAEEEMALGDLVEANQINPANKPVATLLRHIRETAKKRRMADKKTFGGLFERGSIYRHHEDDTVQSDTSTTDERNITIAQAKTMVDALAARGMDKEADAIRHEVEKASSQKAIDFRQPTHQMIKDAEKHGVDLSNNRVVAMLEDMQQQKSNTAEDTTLGKEDASASFPHGPNQLNQLYRLISYLRLRLNIEPKHLALGFITYMIMQFLSR